MRRALLLSLVVAALAGPAPAIDADEMFEDPALEARAMALSKQLRCLVCQNQSIFDSNAGLARDLRLVVRERLAAGDDDPTVIAFVVERYGDYVLLDPPVKTTTAVLWAAPLVLLGGALALGAAYLRRRRPAEATGDGAEVESGRRLLEGDET